MWLKEAFRNRSFLKNLKARNDAKKILNTLRNGKRNHKLIYWTTRPSLLNRLTIQSLERNKLPFDRIYYINRGHACESKLKIVGREKVNTIIESNSEIIESLRKKCQTIIFDTPYNKECIRGKRIYGWKDLEFMIA